MKVESSKPDFLTPSTTDLARTEADRTSSPASRGTTGPVTDQVSLSGDVQLVQSASRAAESAPAVRPDKVAEAKALLATGRVGTDLDSLASAILDSLTK